MASGLKRELRKIEKREMERIIDKVIRKFLIPKFRSLGMNASGQWINTVQSRRNEIWGQEYTYYLTHGREGGTMPPVSAILEWVKAKFGLTGQQAQSTAWAVATKIKQEGTKWYQRGGTDLLNILESKEVTNFINRELKDSIEKKLKKQFREELRERFKVTS